MQTAEREQAKFGAILRSWRTSKGMSQLALSLEAGVSSRHLSFVETGRSTPSREMVLTLAETLEVPLRERNVMLEAAGYAAVYPETPLEAPQMAEVREALAQILAGHEPNPALVVNRRYDIVMANQAAQKLIATFAPAYTGRPNVVSLLLDEQGLRRSVDNWTEVASHVAHRVKTELRSSHRRDQGDEAILAAIDGSELGKTPSHPRTRPPSIVIPMRLRRGDIALSLFTTITTLGTPLDVTLQELRIETLFPTDALAREGLKRLFAEQPPPG